VSITAATTFTIGLRHGVDWDHVTAITDITGTEASRRRGTALALVYAAGHGAVVLVLGLLAAAAGQRLPEWVEPGMERVVGATLLLLGVALLRSLGRGERRSRGVVMLDFLSSARRRFGRDRVIELEHEHPHDHSGMHQHDVETIEPARSTVRTMHRHAHRHEVTLRQYGVPGALAIGALHGFGAETGTQAVVLMTASNAEGFGAAMIVIGTFVLGIFATTAGTAALASMGWTAAGGHERMGRVLTVAAAASSIVVGLAFLAGRSDLLPPLLTAHQ
jgi:high-affinity nickel-transport protein